MFRENKKYQVSLFGIVYQLPVGVKKMLDESWAPAFRKLIFDKIDEKRYAVLYSDIPSRPNFPVNVWVGLETIKYFFDYTDEELMHQWHFNLLTAYALGQEGLGERTVCIRTVYYGRERLLEYEAKTGRNLLGEEFKGITDDALKELGVDTKTQRMDSSFVGSFIKKMSRLEIAVKVLQNFYKELPEAEQKRWQPLLADYLEEEAQHLSFRLRRSEVEAHLIKVGEGLFKLHEAYADDKTLTSLKSYEHIGRVLGEQYQVTKEKEATAIEVKPAKEISPSSLPNPDDAALRNEKENRTETRPTEQLLPNTAVYQSNSSDEAIPVLSETKERTKVEEMIVDAIGEDKTTIALKPAKEISPSSLQNPDVVALRNEKEHRTETCPTEQLPPNTAVYQGNSSDEAIPALSETKERTKVEEMIVDAIGEDKTTIALKPAKEISSSSLQNPADDRATFRRKGGEEKQGYVLNIGETCAPANPLQLLTDIALYPNTTYDETIGADRIPEIKKRSNLEQLITDANFSGPTSEKVCKAEGVTLIPTEMKGRKLAEDELSLKDFQFGAGVVITCPTGQPPVRQIHNEEKERCVIRFSVEECGGCPMVGRCPVVERQKFYSLSFSDRQALVAQQRQKLGQEDYREKCRLRPAVEGTISQFKQRMPNGKLRIRGYEKVRNAVTLMAIGINFGRIWAYLVAKDRHQALFSISTALLFAFVAIIFAARRLWRSLNAERPISETVC